MKIFLAPLFALLAASAASACPTDDGRPYGAGAWQDRIDKAYQLEQARIALAQRFHESAQTQENVSEKTLTRFTTPATASCSLIVWTKAGPIVAGVAQTKCATQQDASKPR